MAPRTPWCRNRTLGHFLGLGFGNAIAALLKEEPVLAYQFDGVRYDCGSKLGYLKANVAYGLKHPELAREFAGHLAALQRHRRRSA